MLAAALCLDLIAREAYACTMSQLSRGGLRRSDVHERARSMDTNVCGRVGWGITACGIKPGTVGENHEQRRAAEEHNDRSGSAMAIPSQLAR